MPDEPATHTEDLANTEYDAGYRARAGTEPAPAPAVPEKAKPLPGAAEKGPPGEGPGVEGEEAAAYRENDA